MSVDESRVDFVIITALEEERDAVLRHLPGSQRLAPSKDHIRVYYSATVPVTFPGGLTGAYRVVVMPLSGMGHTNANAATGDAIRHWNPRYILLVGIAGGIAAKGVRVGDILISDQIVDYELQKITPEGQQIRWETYRADPRLVGAAGNFASNVWRASMTVERPGKGAPKRHIGPIASGNKVIAFEEVLQKYRDKWPALIGVEMEAGGAAAAVSQTAEPPGFFMVRGVSDLADEGKGSARVEKWRAYACDLAAAYAIALLQSGPVVTSVDGQRRPIMESLPTRSGQLTIEKRDADYARPVTVQVLAGDFWLGSPPDDIDAPENTKPGRSLHLPEFEIGRYPVTNVQYARFVRETSYSPPLHWPTAQPPAGLEEHPVVNVSHADAEAYCRWLNQVTQQTYRLPTEAEWEKAARGGLPDKRCFVWGTDWRPNVCNTRELGRNGTTPVYEFEHTNHSVFGVVDLLGNVWEWTASWYQGYPGSAHETGHYGQVYRVVRGGSWNNPARDARLSCRGRYKPDVRRPHLGFRVVLVVGTPGNGAVL